MGMLFLMQTDRSVYSSSNPEQVNKMEEKDYKHDIFFSLLFQFSKGVALVMGKRLDCLKVLIISRIDFVYKYYTLYGVLRI